MQTLATPQPITIEDIAEKIRPVCEARGVEKAIVFGSFARGTQTKRSDIDLLIVVRTHKRFLDRYDDFTEIMVAFFPREVEMLVYTPQELQRNKERPFVRQVLAEGKLVYVS
jgi:predicted nucleotidyltransferase